MTPLFIKGITLMNPDQCLSTNILSHTVARALLNDPTINHVEPFSNPKSKTIYIQNLRRMLHPVRKSTALEHVQQQSAQSNTKEDHHINPVEQYD